MGDAAGVGDAAVVGNGVGGAPVPKDGWLAWEIPGKAVSVRLTVDVAGRLRMAVWGGFKALPRRGLETGGLLIGTTREVGNGVVVEIDDFEPVEIQHASGPSYVLSDADLRLLETKIAAREDPEVPAIVGFYRSHTRSDFAITPEDAALFSSHFPAPSHVFLLIKSHDDGPPTGGFIIREGGKVLSQRPYAEFPLPLSLAPPREIPVPVAPPSQIQPSAAPMVQLPPRLRTTREINRPVWLTVAAVVAGMLLLFGMLKRNPARVAARPGTALALNVASAGNSLRLSWDREALRQGSAVLWIKDGLQEQRFDLDRTQLSQGSIVYWPKNGDVNFRLEVHSPTVNVSESVRAIGGPAMQAQAVAVPSPAQTVFETPPARSSVFNTPPVSRPAGTGAPHTAATPARKPRRSPLGEASRNQSRPFAFPLPATGVAKIASASLPDPPLSQLAPSPAPHHNEDFLSQIVPANSLALGDGSSHVRVSVEPEPGSRLEQLGRNIPLIGRRYRRPDYIPPAPLHYPALPNPPHTDLARLVSVDIKVYVTPSGKVEFAEVLSKVAQSDRGLATLAMFSARRWEFVPARTAEGPVPGAVILRYQFGGAARPAGNQAVAVH